MKQIALTAITPAAALTASAADNAAYADAHARFTVVSDGVVRMEWHDDTQTGNLKGTTRTILPRPCETAPSPTAT